MYCPKCAAPLSDGQKFCRSCGFDLQIISSLLNYESGTDRLDALEFMDLERSQIRKSKLRVHGTIVLMSALMVGCLIPICIGLLSNWTGLNKLVLILAGIAGILLFGGIMILIYADTLPGASANTESAQRTPPWEAPPTNQLPPGAPPESAEFRERPTASLKRPLGKGPRTDR
ncbi:MAG TPA: zinc ribbon domain-containing protein [Blastocatellia bacterium]|nr:zinc ribbon domain-containing protein [Blastocatellia bacterium]